ncbi:MAG: DNA-directed RNA polymerase subunit H [Candidatus Micrarchaeota archaeon]|nr:DNA-directed RNA polymerase subunit H [Candidatus Micrarchaeota archaeon]
MANSENAPIIHHLIPKHEILSEEEEKKILEKYNVTKEQLPRIKIDDPAIRHLNPKKGDIVKIYREDRHAKWTYYRVVV